MGPIYDQIVTLRAIVKQTEPRTLAKSMIDVYIQYGKAFVIHKGKENKQSNKDLESSYKQDPRIFWNLDKHRTVLDNYLVGFATFIHSIRSASSSSESEFSRMSWMISARRSSFTASNANKMLTLGNLLPRKRQLTNLMKSKGIKKQKLFF